MMDIIEKGGPVMYPLLACSMVALTVIIERLMFWIREDTRRNQPLVDRVLSLCQSGEWDAVRGQVKGSKDYVIKVLVSGILHKEFSMTKAMESTAADEIQRMRHFMGVMDTMITVAPLLGIFGTVIGIITSFDILGSTGIDHPQAVTAGIAHTITSIPEWKVRRSPSKSTPPAWRLCTRNSPRGRSSRGEVHREGSRDQSSEGPDRNVAPD
jgi:biopolymer transport protein ExbB